MIIIRDAKVTFCLDQVRANQVPEYVGMDVYFTKHGWFYPVSYYATDILDVLDGKRKKIEKVHDIQKALLITHEGLVYEYTVNRDGVVRRRRCLYSPAFIYHRCDEPKEDQMISTALAVNSELSDMDILNLVLTNTEAVMRELATFNIDWIVEELNVRFPREEEKK